MSALGLLPLLIILSVGHGNCAILIETMGVTIFDCGLSASILLQALRQLKIKIIDRVIISHADSDHIGGLVRLMQHFPVRCIHLNPDSTKSGKTWEDVLEMAKLAELMGIEVHVGLTSQDSKKIISGEVEIEILAPSASLALSGAGGTYLGGHTVSSNAMSVVIGLVHKGCRVALLPGDLNELGLDQLLERQQNIEAKILVFPHHGGSAGGKDDRAFAQRLTSLVQPELVLFSLHRNLHNLPKEAIIEGVRTACPKAHLMCTQLSRKCCPHLFPVSFSYLSDLPAKGFAENSCCGGSICVHLNGTKITSEPDSHIHQQFVREAQLQAARVGHPGPLCLLAPPTKEMISASI